MTASTIICFADGDAGSFFGVNSILNRHLLIGATLVKRNKLAKLRRHAIQEFFAKIHFEQLETLIEWKFESITYIRTNSLTWVLPIAMHCVGVRKTI